MKIVGPFEFCNAFDRVAEHAIGIHRTVLMSAVVEQGDGTSEGWNRKDATIGGRNLLQRRGPRIHGVAWQANNYSDATSRFRNYLHNPSPRIVAPGWRGEVGNGGGTRADDVGTITC